jgi:hypothetical protein
MWNKIRNELLVSGCRLINRVTTQPASGALKREERKAARLPVCPSILTSKEFHVCTVASLCVQPFLVQYVVHTVLLQIHNKLCISTEHLRVT